MSRLQPDKKNKAAGHPLSSKPQLVFAPSIDGGADKEYTVVFEKKAIYNKPSFAR
ncbi:hypothetical protein D3C78_1882090 [compost metagenome]